MTTPGYCLFDTAVGAVAVAWSERGLKGVQLPEADAGRTRARMARRYPDAVEGEPPATIAEAIVGIAALVGGEARDLDDIVLDTEGLEAFPLRVYQVARTIPPGQTLTYGEIAGRIGEPGAARAVGEALGRNPFAIVVPCHRVLAAGGKLGGFSANGGVVAKLRLLEIEGAQIGEPAPLFDDLPVAIKPPRRR
ncbi:MAG TPA: methylated-DNA--[protein]-cysteine S-methyltransferase [Caulobacteraceae bacterium]|jgi:methylated-DNA-[protein]-cysteine S-methyltransferase|nr:methylated-DNA--[protein]-cysteine S-methyltransferase [Caulobacteraceae bacterium]